VFSDGVFRAWIGRYVQSDSLIITYADRVHFSLMWIPVRYTAGTNYSIMVANPDEPPARSEGFSQSFELKYPYQFLAGSYGPCNTAYGTLCGAGTQRRPLYCEDVYSGLQPVTVNGTTTYAYKQVDTSFCGPYGTTPSVLQRFAPFAKDATVGLFP
jgi:hypothetical protein